MDSKEAKPSLKKRLAHEMRSYLATAAFLAVFLLSLTTYRKLILAEYNVGYFQYGYAIVEAMILAKVILVGEALHVGERFLDRPLIVSILWKTLIFSLFTVLFMTIEHVLSALIHHKPPLEELSFAGVAGDEKLARLQLMLVAFLPYFAFREIGRVIGDEQMYAMLFRAPSSRSRPGEPG
jgi:hypothetical protein